MIPVNLIGNEADTRISKSSNQKAWMATPLGVNEIPEEATLPGFGEEQNTFTPSFFEPSADLLKSAAALAEMTERGDLVRCGMLVAPDTGRMAMFAVGDE